MPGRDPLSVFCESHRFRKEVFFCSYFLDEADLECLFCINGTACDEHVKGAVCADHAGEHVYAAGVGAEADAYKGLKEFSIVCGKMKSHPKARFAPPPAAAPATAQITIFDIFLCIKRFQIIF